MKLSLKKVSIWIIVAVAIVIVVAQPNTFQSQLTYQVNTVAAKCSFDVLPEQEIKAEGGRINITVPIQTPTPCYEVGGSVTQSDQNIIVDLETNRVGEICAQCVGTVVGNVMISNLPRGEYNLKVNAPDRELRRAVRIE